MKKTLNLAEMEAQTVTALPDREMPLVFVNVTLLNGNTVVIPINAAANVCGISVTLIGDTDNDGELDCTAKARQG